MFPIEIITDCNYTALNSILIRLCILCLVKIFVYYENNIFFFKYNLRLKAFNVKIL